MKNPFARKPSVKKEVVVAQPSQHQEQFLHQGTPQAMEITALLDELRVTGLHDLERININEQSYQAYLTLGCG